MKYLLDTQILLWVASHPQKIKPPMRKLIEDRSNTLFFSAASIWEVVIKKSLGRVDFQCDPRIFRNALVDNGYLEVPISTEHVLFTQALQGLNQDPIDLILVAQSSLEGMPLLTEDQAIMSYGGSVIFD
jgi:PIN domain nuclease of toxin-antitoxin system